MQDKLYQAFLYVCNWGKAQFIWESTISYIPQKERVQNMFNKHPSWCCSFPKWMTIWRWMGSFSITWKLGFYYLYRNKNYVLGSWRVIVWKWNPYHKNNLQCEHWLKYPPANTGKWQAYLCPPPAAWTAAGMSSKHL